MLDIAALSVTLPSKSGPIHVLRRIDLRLAKGEIHGMIGESGCGKTMTALTLLGLLPEGASVRAERFRFGTLDLSRHVASDLSALRGRRIALISQDPAAALNPVLTIGRQMDDVIRSHHGLAKGARRSMAVEILLATGLPEPEKLLKLYPHQLSGGMQQRVVIAQALATGADFLIADEPTTALDVTVGAQVLKLLRQLVETRGLTVLMITHDMDVVAASCDRATVLYAGISVEEGPVGRLLSAPRHPYTQALLAALPDAAPHGARLATVEGSIPPPTAALPGCAFAARCPFAMPVCASPPPLRQEAGHSWICHLEPT